MDLGLNGKVVLITGASRGIGKGIAAAFAGEGAKVAFCARQESQLKETEQEFKNSGATVFAQRADITNPAQAEAFVNNVLKHFGKIDVLVNNAGGNRRNPFVDTSDQDWEDIIELNLMSHIRISRRVAKSMQTTGGGSIIFISSIFGREGGGPGLSIYNTTKSAMISLSKIMAMELAGQNIRVNNVAPGSIQFPGGSWDKRVKADPEGMKKFVEENIPLGRFGRVEEVANVVLFLASEKASLINGTSIAADGCQSKSLI